MMSSARGHAGGLPARAGLQSTPNALRNLP